MISESTNKKFTRRSNTGFTLIEVIITVAIFVLAMGAVVSFILMLYKTHSYTFQQQTAVNQARKGIETMVKEIREARDGEDGSYPIEKADDKEFIFYSDIDKDNEVERVKYFLGTTSSESQEQTCVTYVDGGSCDVTFPNFLSGTLQQAQVSVSVEGDFGRGNEYAEIYADGIKLDDICRTGCNDCAGTWQGTAVFDVYSQAKDGNIQFIAYASSKVDNFCDWQEPNHAMKAKFEFSWTETLSGGESDLKKGVINPTGPPDFYPQDQEEVTVLSKYVRNTPPIFRYFDADGNEIVELPARLVDTKLMTVFLVVNVDPNRPPQDFELESSVQIRNLK